MATEEELISKIAASISAQSTDVEDRDNKNDELIIPKLRIDEVEENLLSSELSKSSRDLIATRINLEKEIQSLDDFLNMSSWRKRRVKIKRKTEDEKENKRDVVPNFLSQINSFSEYIHENWTGDHSENENTKNGKVSSTEKKKKKRRKKKKKKKKKNLVGRNKKIVGGNVLINSSSTRLSTKKSNKRKRIKSNLE